ncbi:MAG: hypothetical protein RR197_03845 [Oscillospiraceae bacterium]
MKRRPCADVTFHSAFHLYTNENAVSYLASGIVALDGEGNTVASIGDVSRDFEWVEELVERLNAGRANPQQLADIVADELVRRIG